MAVFLELTTDLFESSFSKQTPGSRTGGLNKSVPTRRPLRGLEIKEETHAYLKVVQANGQAIKLLDAGTPTGNTEEYSNFILQQVTEQRMERHQIVETFGDTYLFLFGESPRFLQISAVLLNSNDFNWKAEFMENYDKYLRGTKAIERGARTYLFYDTNIVEGYILNAQVNEDSMHPMEVPISFQFFVTNHQNISVIGDTNPNFPVRSSAIIPGGLDPTNPEDTYFFETFYGDSSASAGALAASGRTLPIRGLISDNTDEYLGSVPDPDYSDLIQDLDIDNLNTALGDSMDAYGVDPTYAYGRDAPNQLGYSPIFGPRAFASAAAGLSSMATFGALATASASLSVGAFAGVNVSASASAFAGVSASAGAGSFAGPRLNQYGQQVNQYGQVMNGPGSALGAGSAPAPRGVGAFFGASVGARAGVGANAFFGSGTSANAAVNARLGSSRSPTSRNKGTATAFASSKSGVRNTEGGSYAFFNARASAQAGGYAGANAGLGATPGTQGGPNPFGNAGSGAAITVTGQPSAFSFTSAPGTLRNSELPPSTALAQTPKPWSWSKQKQWPSE